jgi:RNA polymerase sigma-70 factor (ECF subfamily)
MDYKGDIVYIEQVLNGRSDAYGFIVDRHKDRVFNLAYRICCNREDAEEIAQDSFLKAFRSLSCFKMKSTFSTWLYRIVYNTAISHIRTKKQGVLSLSDFPDDKLEFISSGVDDEASESEYRCFLVNHAMKVINEEERGLITLFYYEEMSIEEISLATGLSKSAVKVKLFRSRQKMLDFIGKTENKKMIC